MIEDSVRIPGLVFCSFFFTSAEHLGGKKERTPPLQKDVKLKQRASLRLSSKVRQVNLQGDAAALNQLLLHVCVVATLSILWRSRALLMEIQNDGLLPGLLEHLGLP